MGKNKEESVFKKRQVSFDQLDALLDFLKEHKELAKGLTRGRKGKLQSLKVWNLCAKKLNLIKGAIKDGRGWSKYWCDWKYRVRRRALELKAAEDNNTGPPEGVSQLSAMEETILNIIGDNAVEGIVIKQYPLAEAASGVEETDTFQHVDTNGNQFCETEFQERRGRKRRISSTSDSEDHSEPRPIAEKDVLQPEVSEQNNEQKNEELENENDNDNEAAEFLQLERENLENSKRLAASIQTIALELSRLVEVMGHIRDFLINNTITI